MVGSVPVQSMDGPTCPSILRLSSPSCEPPPSFFHCGLPLDLAPILSVPLRACCRAFPAPCFPRRLYGGRLARTFPHRRDVGLRPLGSHRSAPATARPRRHHRPPPAARPATGLHPWTRPQSPA